MRGRAYRIARSLLAVLSACAGSATASHDAALDARTQNAGHQSLANKRDGGTQSAAAPRGNLRGRIAGLAATDSVNGVLSAGAESRAFSGNYFALDRVPSGPQVSVSARIPGYSLGQAVVSVESERTTLVLLGVVKLRAVSIADLSAEQRLSFGSDDARHTLALPPDGLAGVTGAVHGAATFLGGVLAANSAPGGMWVQDAGTRFRFRSLAMVELRALQPGAALVLSRTAQLTLHVASGAAPQLQVYRFDEALGVWQKYALADHDAATHMLNVSIEQFGVYAAGEPLTQLGCAALNITDPSGEPLSRAAIGFADEQGSEGTLVWSDDSGHACLAASAGAPLSYTVLAQAGQELRLGTGNLVGSSAAASCGAGCADAGTHVPGIAPVGCVRGRIAANGAAASVTLWTSAVAGAEANAGRLYPGGEFCLEVSDVTRLRFASTLDCGEPRTFSAGASGASCAGGECVDLGTIQCCADAESCADGVDDDCDQRVDEGCQCGSNDCSAARAARLGADYCCTDTALCGTRDRANKLDKSHCFDSQTKARPDAAECGNEVVDLGSGKQALSGCCRADQRCGLKISPFECVAREESKYFVVGTAAPPAAKSCTY